MVAVVPPVPFAVAVPSQLPWQLGFSGLVTVASSSGGSFMVIAIVAVQDWASVTVTEYGPIARALKFWLLDPVFHS